MTRIKVILKFRKNVHIPCDVVDLVQLIVLVKYHSIQKPAN